jgi:hypothetical protein
MRVVRLTTAASSPAGPRAAPCAILLDLEAVVCLTRVVVTDDLDEPPIAGARAVGDDDAVVRLLLAADAA